MESRSLVVEGLSGVTDPSRSVAQSGEVGNSLGYDITKETEGNTASLLSFDFNIKEHFLSYFSESVSGHSDGTHEGENGGFHIFFNNYKLNLME